MLRKILYGTLETVGSAALVVGCAAAVLSLSGCSVNVVVAPNATLAVKSDLSKNSNHELVLEQAQ